MSTMTDTIMQQVTKQMKKAMEATNSARPLPHFDYMPTTGCEPSYRHVPVALHHHSDEVREVACPDRNDRSRGENCDWSIGMDAIQSQYTDGGEGAPNGKKATADDLLTETTQCTETGPRFLRKEREPAWLKPREEECFTEIVATIACGYEKGITRSAWKA
ncbi:hypothetical protein Cgig2_024024 [Carnegiea gigantea]|uniref:Uncharacterized protein n=1 Tax=Carnegiea gigantea TaxID=171969 RepID=A0A9Q1KK67_9CARY|nr:hypothetical protein Cgig2_024024 [Carnegiea gigantea]